MEPKDILPNETENEQGSTQDASAAGNKDLKAEVEAAKASADQWQQKYVQVFADMQNYKRRMEKEQFTWTRRAQEAILLQLLPIVDDFDRALNEHKKHPDQELSAWMAGFEMISKELYKFLKSVHVTEISTSAAFDPELHEAIAQIESADVPSGDIVETVQKGYMLGDEVLRPAKVVVAR